jgi:uncharacterized protein (DUF1499 family)
MPPSRPGAAAPFRGLARLLALGLALLALVAAPLPVQASLLHLEGPVPEELGVRAGSLAPCPAPDHCARADWSRADPAADLEQLALLLADTPDISVLERRGPYLHATATSRLFGFVDDLELLADPDHSLLQARSVSRLGDSDLGVNARRLERLRAALVADPSPA